MAGKYDFPILQGEDFSKVFTWKDSAHSPVDITSYTAVMYIKENVDSTTYLATSEGGSPTIGIALGGSLGTITVTMTKANTLLLSFDTAIYVLELTDGSSKTRRLLEGEVKLSRR